jgi:hypothetical protein
MNNITMSAKRDNSRKRRSTRKSVYSKSERTKLKRELLELMNKVIKGGKQSIKDLRNSSLENVQKTQSIDFLQELLDAILVKSVLIETGTVIIKNAKRVSDLTKEVREFIHYMGEVNEPESNEAESNNSNIEGLIGAFKNVGMEGPSDYLDGLMAAFEKVKIKDE